MKKVSLSRVFGWCVLGLALAIPVQSCGSSLEGKATGGSGATGGAPVLDSGDAVVDVTTPDDGGSGGEAPYNPLCGVVDCVPDRANACPSSDAGSSGSSSSSGSSGSSSSSGSSGTGPSGSGGSAGEGGAGAGGAPGEGGKGPGGAPNDGGMGGEGGQGASGNSGGLAGEAGTSGTGAVSGSGGSAPGTIVNSCQVRRKNGAPRAQCVPAGPGAADAPCLSGSDCAPGLACVREGEAGQCRPYCCEGSCPERTHCFERVLFGLSPDMQVPVCVPSVDCGLAEPYPCPEGTTCSCPDGLACMVVGTDRTTTCAEPGPGREGWNCPCDWNHVCSQVTNRCVKLCQTADPAMSCETGMCQASAELPPGWGVCVGMPRP